MPSYERIGASGRQKILLLVLDHELTGSYSEPEVGFREVGNCVGAGRRLRARARPTRELRCGEHAWAGAADTRSRRIFIAENHSSTALVGCSRTVGSALAATAIVGAVAQHWRSWMLECSAHLVADKPDWSWGSARGPHRSECPPKLSPRC